MAEDMDRLTVLESIEEIKRLKSKYFYYLDHKNFDGWRNEVLCTDAVMWTPFESVEASQGGKELQPLVGVEMIISTLKSVLADVVTVHQGHMPDIQITSPTTATGVWALEDILLLAGSMKVNGECLRMHGYGNYHETYVRESRGWRIKTMLLTRIFNLNTLTAPPERWKGSPKKRVKELVAPSGIVLGIELQAK
jgi:hypothetical protein